MPAHKIAFSFRVCTPCTATFNTLTAGLSALTGEGLRRLEYRIGRWDKDLAAYLATLRARKPIIVCGDLNCAHHEIDLHSPKTNLCVPASLLGAFTARSVGCYGNFL